MDSFNYRSGRLHAEDVSAADLIAEFGSPLYVYSKATFIDHYGKLAAAFAEFAPVLVRQLSDPEVFIDRRPQLAPYNSDESGNDTDESG